MLESQLPGSVIVLCSVVLSMGMMQIQAEFAEATAAGKDNRVMTASKNQTCDRFTRRGVIISLNDLSWAEWPERAACVGLNTLALSGSIRSLREFVDSTSGESFLKRCDALGLQVEYEFHAMSELLPRNLFDASPELFRMSEDQQRTSQGNFCVHSEEAMGIVEKNAVEVARALSPATHRYFFWGDDGEPWCRCPRCREFSDSEQALLVENRLLGALRAVDSSAQIAHIAYVTTLPAPRRVAPLPGVFLEFAPFKRRFDQPISEPGVPENEEHLRRLEENLDVFPHNTAQVLEYWLDCSLFSQWKRPAAKIPWSTQVFLSDLDSYHRLGVRQVTTFAVFVDGGYVKTYGEPPLTEYGAGLLGTLRNP